MKIIRENKEIGSTPVEEVTIAQAKSDNTEARKKVDDLINPEKRIKEEPVTGHDKKDYPNKVKVPDVALDESFLDEADNTAANLLDRAKKRSDRMPHKQNATPNKDNQDKTGLDDTHWQQLQQALYGKKSNTKGQNRAEIKQSDLTPAEQNTHQNNDDFFPTDDTTPDEKFQTILNRDIEPQDFGNVNIDRHGRMHVMDNGRNDIGLGRKGALDLANKIVRLSNKLIDEDMNGIVRHGLEDETAIDAIEKHRKELDDKERYGNYNDNLVTIEDGKICIGDICLNKREAQKLAYRIMNMSDSLNEGHDAATNAERNAKKAAKNAYKYAQSIKDQNAVDYINKNPHRNQVQDAEMAMDMANKAAKDANNARKERDTRDWVSNKKAQEIQHKLYGKNEDLNYEFDDTIDRQDICMDCLPECEPYNPECCELDDEFDMGCINTPECDMNEMPCYTTEIQIMKFGC